MPTGHYILACGCQRLFKETVRFVKHFPRQDGFPGQGMHRKDRDTEFGVVFFGVLVVFAELIQITIDLPHERSGLAVISIEELVLRLDRIVAETPTACNIVAAGVVISVIIDIPAAVFFKKTQELPVVIGSGFFVMDNTHIFLAHKPTPLGQILIGTTVDLAVDMDQARHGARLSAISKLHPFDRFDFFRRESVHMISAESHIFLSVRI